MKEIDLDSCLESCFEAFWNEATMYHERRGRNLKTGDLPASEAYDMEKYARNALEAWIELNVPKIEYFVQRTTVHVIKVMAHSAEEAEADVADMMLADWDDMSIDTSIEYIVLDAAGQVAS